MKRFRDRLAQHNTADTHRRWLFVSYDQLSDGLGPLASEDPSTLGIVVVENPWKAAQRPYHQQKLALVLANLRHFALEQAVRGVAVRHVVTQGSYCDALTPLVDELGPLCMMMPAERELRADLAPLAENGDLEMLPHGGWLTTPEQFASLGAPPWRMDAFYRRVRQDTGILMDDGKPVGGKYSFDAENRKPWRGDPAAPEPPCFRPDDVTEEVGALVSERYGHHPGTVDLDHVPATLDDAEQLWRWALDACLPSFGPYEDAMSVDEPGLFHTRIAPLLNLHRLLPRRILEDVLAADLPLASREGFVRQVLGWREFVHHVHRATDGFRDLPETPVSTTPGDGGWSHWTGAAWPNEPANEQAEGQTAEQADEHPSPNPAPGGAAPSFLGSHLDLPAAFWGLESGLACLDHVVADVWREGWSHHITRLMVLANLATLLDVEPRQLTDWFWVAYIDAYDWVVEPNVLAMGTFGTGALMTTKPYVSGAAYIHRMSDYCATCRFHPKKNCPITPLYWAFLHRHRAQLDGNHRLAMPLRNVDKRAPAQRDADQHAFATVRARLDAGHTLRPSDFEDDGA